MGLQWLSSFVRNDNSFGIDSFFANGSWNLYIASQSSTRLSKLYHLFVYFLKLISELSIFRIESFFMSSLSSDTPPDVSSPSSLVIYPTNYSNYPRFSLNIPDTRHSLLSLALFARSRINRRIRRLVYP